MRLGTGLGLGALPGAGALPPPAARPTHVFLVAGQSNATSRAPFDDGAGWPATAYQLERWNPLDPVDDQPAGNLVAAGGARRIAAARPLHHVFPTKAGHFGWALQFAIDHAAANPGVDLLLVPAARGGTGFSDNRWNPGDDLYADAVARANRAMAIAPEPSFEGILWHQGESDAGSQAAVDAHAAGLDAMIAGMRSAITGASASTPFILGGMVPSWVAGGTLRQQVQARIEQTVHRVAHTGFADAAGTTAQADGLHFDAAAMRVLGGRYHAALAAARANTLAEAGAAAHWLLGADNPGDADLVSGQPLAPNGTAPTRAPGFVSVSGVANGLLSPVADRADLTMAFAVRVAGAVDAVLGGTLNTGSAATPSGLSPLFHGPDLKVNHLGGAGLTLLEAGPPAGAWLFVALSLSASGQRVYFVGAPTPVVDAGSGARGPVSTRKVALGDVHNATSFGGPFDCAEMILFDSALGLPEIEAVYARSRARLAARGIALR